MVTMRQILNCMISALLMLIKCAVIVIGAVSNLLLGMVSRILLFAGLLTAFLCSTRQGIVMIAAAFFSRYLMPLICSVTIAVLDYLKEKVEDFL